MYMDDYEILLLEEIIIKVETESESKELRKVHFPLVCKRRYQSEEKRKKERNYSKRNFFVKKAKKFAKNVQKSSNFKQK